MPTFEPRHVLASSTGRRALLGAFQHTVAILDLDRGRLAAPFDTTFDFGGRRLALTDELDAVVAGAYERHGVALYSCDTGKELWRRKDLKRLQHITLSRDGLSAYCGLEGASLAVLDLRSGETTQTERGARLLLDSPYDEAQFVDAARPLVVELAERGAPKEKAAGGRRRRFFVERTRAAFLDAAFAPGALLLSEVRGPVRCLDVTSGAERWRYQPEAGRHILHLGYRDSEHTVLGLDWCCERGGTKRVLRWRLDSGALAGVCEVGEPTEACFAGGGEVLVTTGGEALAVETAAKVC